MSTPTPDDADFPEEVEVNLINPTSWTIKVRGAKNLQDAINKALNQEPRGLCFSCSSERNDGEWDVHSVHTPDGKTIYSEDPGDQ